MMNVKKIISLIMLLFMLLPLGAQNSEGKQRYKIGHGRLGKTGYF